MIHRIAMRGVAVVAALAAAGAAHAADITLTDAKIAAGLLLVSGATAVPNTEVRLDGQTGTPFNVTSDASGLFAFKLVYHPGDCVVTLQRVVPPYGTLGAATEALVADCGRDGVSWRGAWRDGVPYAVSDLVTHDGAAWRARRNNIGRAPAESADWEIFAAAGEAATAPDAAAGTARVEPTGPAGGDLAGTYPNPTIRLLSIGSAKIGNGVVITEKLANNAVTTAKILDDTIRSLDIFNGTILSQDIADGTIAGIDVADGSLTSDDILDETITSADLALNSVSSAEIANDAINSANVVNESLTSSDLATNSVNATEIANNSIDSGEISPDSLLASDLAGASVGSSELQDGAVGTAELASNAVTGSKVANNSLTTADIAGADVNGGGISVPTGYVPNGRCRQLDASVGGATAGEAVIFSLKAALQDGVLIYGQRVPSNGHVTFSVCNFSGTTQAAISDIPVRVITFN